MRTIRNRSTCLARPLFLSSLLRQPVLKHRNNILEIIYSVLKSSGQPVGFPEPLKIGATATVARDPDRLTKVENSLIIVETALVYLSKAYVIQSNIKFVARPRQFQALQVHLYSIPRKPLLTLRLMVGTPFIQTAESGVTPGGRL